MRKTLYLLILTSFISIIGVTPSFAHASLVSSSLTSSLALPKQGAVEFKFNERVHLAEGNFQILDDKLLLITKNTQPSDSDSIRLNYKLTRKGFYMIRYKVESEDGHPLFNSIVFNYGYNTTSSKSSNREIKSIDGKNSLSVYGNKLKIGSNELTFSDLSELSITYKNKSIVMYPQLVLVNGKVKTRVILPWKGEYQLIYKRIDAEYNQFVYVENIKL